MPTSRLSIGNVSRFTLKWDESTTKTYKRLITYILTSMWESASTTGRGSCWLIQRRSESLTRSWPRERIERWSRGISMHCKELICSPKKWWNLEILNSNQRFSNHMSKERSLKGWSKPFWLSAVTSTIRIWRSKVWRGSVDTPKRASG